MLANDHRAIARRMDLFHLQEEGPGMVFWHPRGFAIYQVIEDYIRRRMRAAGFAEVRTPQILASSLWQASGHLDKFRGSMFLLDDGDRAFALKPMSCPGHVQLLNSRLRSFRDLPLRYCEFGHCLRNEPSGALLGLMRTRSFVQDDAHIFCRESQIEAEVANFVGLLQSIYRDFGFPEVEVRLGTRPAARAGSGELWDRAEATLAAAARAAGLAFDAFQGEGAFYGPKLEFHLRDRQGRLWQCGTIQLDFVLPARLAASFVGESNNKEIPVMLHQAVLGSVERFIGILLEHHEGRLPLWLAPEQLLIATIGAEQDGYAREVEKQLARLGYRTKLDLRGERLARKVAESHEAGIPLVLAVGAREAAGESVTLRWPDGRRVVLPLAALEQELRAAAVDLI